MSLKDCSDQNNYKWSNSLESVNPRTFKQVTNTSPNTTFYIKTILQHLSQLPLIFKIFSLYKSIYLTTA